MRKTLIAAIAALAVPATAQMNPAAIGGGMVMPSAINAQENSIMRRQSSGVSRSSGGYDPQSAAYCARIPSYRRELGPHNSDVITLERMCRSRGYAIR